MGQSGQSHRQSMVPGEIENTRESARTKSVISLLRMLAVFPRIKVSNPKPFLLYYYQVHNHDMMVYFQAFESTKPQTPFHTGSSS